MRELLPLAIICVFMMACAPDQEAARWVEAVEIPMEVPAERDELAQLLSTEAQNHSGLHVDDVSTRSERYYTGSDILEPDQRPTVSISVWRGDDDDHLVATVSDLFHRGRVWATFNRGENPEQETPFREAAIELIRKRWPETKSLPVLPSGGLGHPQDFVLTANGYKIKRSEAQKYELPPNSSLLTLN